MRVFCHVCETTHERSGEFYSSPLTHTINEDGVKTNLAVGACADCQKIPGAVRRAFDRWCAGYRPSSNFLDDHIKVIKVDI